MTGTLTDDSTERVARVLEAIGPVTVAVSGGVDSMTLAAFAHARNPADARMAHAVSPAVPAAATARVRRRARADGWALSVVEAGEFDDPDYLANPSDRCYFCKTNLYRAVRAVVGGSGKATVVSGANIDDLGDYRPGLEAAREWRVRHPWVEAGVDKAGVRRLARRLGLADVADLPSSPCLSSRVETGIAIEGDVLGAVDAAERYVRRRLGARTVRCRVRADGVAVELDADALDALAPGERASLAPAVAAMFARARRGGEAPRVRFEAYRRGSAFLHPHGR